MAPLDNRLKKLEKWVHPPKERPFQVVYEEDGHYWIEENGSNTTGASSGSGRRVISQEEFVHMHEKYFVILVTYRDNADVDE